MGIVSLKIMIRILLISILLTACSGFPRENPISSLFDECYYAIDGTTKGPCISQKSFMPVIHQWVEPTADLNDYAIFYKGQHTYSAVRRICKAITGKEVNGCIMYTDDWATIWHVYGDQPIIKHELDHLAYDDRK